MKSIGDCQGTTSIRRALLEGVLCLLIGMAYDPSSLGADTRQACDLEGVGAEARQGKSRIAIWSCLSYCTMNI